MAVEINGDGLITVDGTSTTQGRVRLKEDTDNGSNYVELTAPASVTANRTITFPDDTGTVLTNSGNQTGVFSALTVNSNNISADNSLGFRNRIINGAMVIDQRNAGASVGTGSGSTVYTVDRWQAQYEATSKFTVQQSTVAPTGFVNSLLVTSSSAYSPTSTQWFAVAQNIEGVNIADLGWGAAGAQSITVSFWVRSSLTGTFGGSVTNASWGRSYPFSYTISAANTWEQKTVTIAGDTTGTWNTNTSTGLTLRFSLGTGSSISNTAGAWYGSQVFAPTGATSVVGTNGATFYITGVQLEVGSVATPFERRPYGAELMLCQRYYQRNTLSTNSYPFSAGYAYQNNTLAGYLPLAVPMRATPTAAIVGTMTVRGSGLSNQNITTLGAIYYQDSPAAVVVFCNPETSATNLVSTNTYVLCNQSNGGGFTLSAEL